MGNEAQLSFGIFWLVSESTDLAGYELIAFKVLCDRSGNATEIPAIPLNSKSGGSYNHKAMWEAHVKNNPRHKPFNRKGFNYYPRGRVEVKHDRATIYLNPLLTQPDIVGKIKRVFGLCPESITSIRIIADNSAHYACSIGD
jgi:hypothetical protein